MEYNTTRNSLRIREYGRHIQKMVEQTIVMENGEQKQRNVQAIIELMGFLNPHLKNVDDFRHKLWDNLFQIADFQLEGIESPYPIPTRESLTEKPKPLPYPKRKPKHSHLGKNLELVIKKALDDDDQERRAHFANAIAYYMKLAYSTWHKESSHDDAIQSELNAITDGKLTFTNTPHVKTYRQSNDRSFSKQRNNNKFGSGGRNNNNNDNRNNNNRRNENRNNDNRNNSGFKKKRY